MDSNGLKLNDSKFEFVLLGSPQMLSKVKSETWAQIQGGGGGQGDMVPPPPHNFEDGGHNIKCPPTNLGIGRTYITVI